MGRKGVRNKLNDTEKRFLEAYTTPGTKTFQNATASYQKAFGTSYNTAKAAGYNVVKRPLIQRSMKAMLSETDISDKVRDGLQQIADGFVSPERLYKAKEFLEMARLVTEIRGDKAPDKQVVLTLTAEDRAKEYEDITNRVLKTQKKVAVTVEEPDELPAPGPKEV